jgi:hypothetical protein
MKIYQNSENWINRELPLNIEAKVHANGELLEPISSAKLLELINSIQTSRSEGAIWTDCPVVKELGLYKANVWIDSELHTIKVWVVPAQEDK